jgi:hypothetical protein
VTPGRSIRLDSLRRLYRISCERVCGNRNCESDASSRQCMGRISDLFVSGDFSLLAPTRVDFSFLELVTKLHPATHFHVRFRFNKSVPRTPPRASAAVPATSSSFLSTHSDSEHFLHQNIKWNVIHSLRVTAAATIFNMSYSIDEIASRLATSTCLALPL